MFTTIKSLIPEPRQADQPRDYVGRHRVPETVTARAAVTVVPGAASPAETEGVADTATQTRAEEELPAVG
jgi:hypothetical protein